MLVHAPTQPGHPINEDSPLDLQPLPYRESKIRTEQLIREQHDGMPVVIVRPGGVYDDGGHSAFLAQQIARIYERPLVGHVYPGALETGQIGRADCRAKGGQYGYVWGVAGSLNKK